MNIAPEAYLTATTGKMKKEITNLNHLRVYLFFALLMISGCLHSESFEMETESFMLSWQQDPTSTMTIDWYSEPGSRSQLEYRPKGTDEWTTKTGHTVRIPESDRTFQRHELTGLQPGARYEFRFTGSEPTYYFRTMPEELDRPLRFIATGDMLHTVEWLRNTAISAMSIDEGDYDFVVVGGDLAYSDGEERKMWRWLEYFKVWSEVMVTENGRAIPHLAAIGNHEVKRGFVHQYPVSETRSPGFVEREAPYFSTFIPFPGPDAYGVLDFGEYLSLFLLDSNHATCVAGEQTDWLRQQMHQRQHVRHLIPVYHVPAWPSARDFNEKNVRAVRENWVPVFEEYGVRVAFEHHDHTYKRTYPIREGRHDETGVYYIGDGAWGVRTREIRTDEDGNRPWYLAEAREIRHFIVVEMDDDGYQLDVFDEEARHIDEVYIPR